MLMLVSTSSSPAVAEKRDDGNSGGRGDVKKVVLM